MGELAAAGRVAGLGRQRQPLHREARVAGHAEAGGEAGADAGLRPGVARVGERSPEGERPGVVAAAGGGLGPGHRVVGLGAAAQPSHGARPARLARKPASSSRQRRSRTSPPSAMRPITGTGRRAEGGGEGDDPAGSGVRGADGEAGARHRLGRQRAGADLAAAVGGLDREARADGRGEIGTQPLGERGDRGPRAGKQAQRRQALGQAVRVAVEAQRRLERGDADLVEPHGALHRVAADARDELAAADDEAGLRAAEQLVAREGDEVGALGDRLGDGRLARQAVGGEVDEGAGAEVVDERHAVVMGDPRQFGRRHRLGEALDPVVGGVDLQDQPGLGTERAGIVAGVGAVGGADLDEPGAGTRHDVGHAEGAADLDQLAARHDRLAALGQRVQRQQHRGGVVVDDGGVLRPGQLDEQVAQRRVALAAPAAAEVELERQRLPHGGDRRLDRGLGEQRPAEVGVEHGAGQIEDRTHLRPRRGVERARRVGRHRFRAGDGAVGAQRREALAHGGERRLAAVAGDRLGGGGGAEHPVDGRQAGGRVHAQ